jgi:flagellar protein FliS
MTPASAKALAVYQNAAVTTASPMRLVVMLYERLVRDMRTAETALGGGDAVTANDQLKHAQEIILELRASLDTTRWEAGEHLARLYDFLHDELVSANTSKDPGRVASCRALVEPLLDAWQTATAATATAATAPAL